MEKVKGVLNLIIDKLKSLDKRILMILGAFVALLIIFMVVVPIIKAIFVPKAILTYEKTTNTANQFVIKYTIYSNGKIEVIREQEGEVIKKKYKLSGSVTKKIKNNIKQTKGSILPKKSKENYAIINIYNSSSKNWIEISGVFQNKNDDNELAKSYAEVLNEVTEKYTDKIEAYRLKLKK